MEVGRQNPVNTQKRSRKSEVSGFLNEIQFNMKNFTLEIKWGIIFTIAAFLWILLEKMMGWHGKNIEQYAFNTWFFFIPATHIYVSALKAKRDKFFGGKINWFTGLHTGLVITAVVILLNLPLQYFFIQLISPDFCTNAINYVVKSGKMNLSEAEIFYNLKNLIIQSSLKTMIFGIVISAIVSIFVRKK